MLLNLNIIVIFVIFQLFKLRFDNDKRWYVVMYYEGNFIA